MKKIIALVCMLFILNVPVYSATTYSQQLSNIEKTIFGYDYKSDTETNRIIRIEKHLYGNSSSGDVKNRVSKISNDLGINPNAAPKSSDNNKIASSENNTKTQKRAQPISVNEDPSVEYPIIDKIEQKVFNELHKGENIYARLDRLEMKVFNNVSNEDLSSRVNKLRLSVFDSKEAMNERYAYSSNYDKVGQNRNSYDDVDYDSKSYNYSSTYGGSDNDSFSYKLSAIEEAMLKKSYPHDSTSDRLARIENKLFKRDFKSESDPERVERIAAAVSAKQSSQMYDNNRLMRNVATGAQVGSILLMILAMLL